MRSKVKVIWTVKVEVDKSSIFKLILPTRNGSTTHQSTPSGRSPLQDCCLRGNNTDLATHLRKYKINQSISIQLYHSLPPVLLSPSSSLKKLVCWSPVLSPSSPSRGLSASDQERAAYNNRHLGQEVASSRNSTPLGVNLRSLYGSYIVYFSDCLKIILTSGFASTEHLSKRSVPSTEWVTMQDGGKRTDKVIVVSSVPWMLDARQV